MIIFNFYECQDIRRAVVQITNRALWENIFVVWDLENNGELCNYSTGGFNDFVQGFSSQTGYILTYNSYINLDNWVANPFFDHDFSSSLGNYNLRYSGGYKINAKGKLIYVKYK